MTKTLNASEISVDRELAKKAAPANDSDWYPVDSGDDDVGDYDNFG